MNGGVNRVFDTAFTRVFVSSEIRAVVAHVTRFEIDGLLWLSLRQFSAEVLFAEPSRSPSGKEAFEGFPLKAALGSVQKFEVVCDGNDVLPVIPFSAYFEIAEDLGGNIGFKRSFDCRAETLFGRSKVRRLGGDVKEANGIQLAKER